MRRSFLFLLVGCGDGGSDSTSNTEADADTDADSDTDTDADPPCVALTEGDWWMNGTCFGMPMAAYVSLEDDGCTFRFTGWSMAMWSPDGGTIVDKNITFSGDDGWDNCTGTTTGTSIEGSCPDKGCNVVMGAK